MNAKSESALQSLLLCVGPLDENCYLLWRDGGTEAVVFDPGAEAHTIQAALDERNLTPIAFVLTHCHGDHIGALTKMKNRHPDVPVYCPAAEAEWLGKPVLNLSYFVGDNVKADPADHLVNDGDELELWGLKLKAIWVPGHSPGGTAYYVEDPAGGAPHLFAGDILFQGSIGRIDLPGGGGETLLIDGIRAKLFPLPDTTIVHPGHGPETTLGEEKKFNPFCGLGAG